MLLGTVLLPDVTARRASALAAVAAGLALAALRAAVTPLPPGFLAVDGALAVLAILLAGSGLLALRRPREAAAAIAAASLAAGAVCLGWTARAVIATAPKVGLLVASAALAAIGAVLFLIGRLVRLPPPMDEAPRPRPPAAVLALLAGGVAAAAGPHLSVVVVGAIVAASCGWLLERTAGGSRVPLAPLLTLLLLPAYWLIGTIAGPEGLALGTLPTLPISPAAERLLAPIFLVAAWATAGLWPLHRQVPAALVAPVGALLLVRVALPLVPAGLEHWRPLAMPVIVAGIWHAALSGRLTRVAVGVAWVGLLGASHEGRVGAALLFSGGLTRELLRHAGGRFGRWAPVVRVAAVLAAGAGALLAVESGLGAEVVYTVIAVGGVALAAIRTPPDGGLTP